MSIPVILSIMKNECIKRRLPAQVVELVILELNDSDYMSEKINIWIELELI